MKLIYNGKIIDGALKIFNLGKLKKEVKMWDDKNVYIAIYLRRKTRSLMQNAYYWGVVVPIIKDALVDQGWKITNKEAHDHLKSEFGKGELINETTGVILETRMSTAKMSTVRFMEYIDDIQQWSAEYLNTVVPDPNQQIECEFDGQT